MFATKTYRILPLSELVAAAENFTAATTASATEEEEEEEEEEAIPLILAKLSIVQSVPSDIITTNNYYNNTTSSYPRGTLLLTDSAAAAAAAADVKVPCRLTKCRMPWYDRLVLFRSWHLILMKATNAYTSTWVEADSDDVAHVPDRHPIMLHTLGTLISLNLEDLWKTFQDPQISLLSEYLLTNQNIVTLQSLQSPKEPLGNHLTTILARIHAKSSLMPDSALALFFIEICDINSTSVYSFIMFRGDEFLRFHEYLQVGQCYIFVKCKVQRLKVKKVILIFGEDVFPVPELEAETLYNKILTSQQLPMLPPSWTSLVPSLDQPSNALLFTNVPSNFLLTPSSSYRGVITLIVDASMSLFVLDNTYLLSLAHNYTSLPERPYVVGTELLLHNLHFIKIYGNWCSVKEILDPYETSPMPYWNVFVACTYTSIQVIEFAQRQNPYKTTSLVNAPIIDPYGEKLPIWLRSRFSFLYSIRLKELVAAWKSKFPIYISEIFQCKNLYELPFILYLMKRIYNTQLMIRNIPDEFINHKTRPCPVLFGNEELNPNSPTNEAHIIGTPDLFKFWREVQGTFLNSMRSWQAIDESQNDNLYEEIASYDSPTKEAHSLLKGQYLLGFLFAGQEFGGLFLMDAKYRIPVIIDGDRPIRVEELGHLWCIKKFRVVIKKQEDSNSFVKAHLYLDWDHTSKLLVRLRNNVKLTDVFGASGNQLTNAFIFQVRRKESRKDENPSLEVVEGISFAIKPGTVLNSSQDYPPIVSLYPPVNVVLNFRLGARRIDVLPALHVGCWYYIIPDSKSIHQNIGDGHPQNFTVTRQWIWRSFASANFGETLELATDLNLVDMFGDSIPSLELVLKEESQMNLLEAHRSFSYLN